MRFPTHYPLPRALRREHAVILWSVLMQAGNETAKSRFAPLRVLLALDGQRLTRDMQHVALRCCLHWTRRLDILLVNPPKAPTFMLGGLLLRLEHSGIDYRLESCEEDYANAVLRYLQRFPGVGLVIANALVAIDDHVSAQQLDPASFSQRFIDLAEPDRVRHLGEAT